MARERQLFKSLQFTRYSLANNCCYTRLPAFPHKRHLDQSGMRHVHWGDPAEEHRRDETTRPVAGRPRGLRAGRAVLCQGFGHQKPLRLSFVTVLEERIPEAIAILG